MRVICAQHFDAVHARHFEIEGDDVGAQFLDLAQADQAVHRRAHDFDRGIAQQGLRNELPHERRIIHHEDADLFAHAVAPSGENSGKVRDDRGNVEDQDDGSVAENRSAAHQSEK